MASNEVVTFARQVLARAAHTAWQAGAATAGTLWATSGLHASSLETAHGLSVLWSAVIVGALAAGLSAAKTVVLGSMTKAADAVMEQEIGTADAGAQHSA